MLRSATNTHIRNILWDNRRRITDRQPIVRADMLATYTSGEDACERVLFSHINAPLIGVIGPIFSGHFFPGYKHPAVPLFVAHVPAHHITHILTCLVCRTKRWRWLWRRAWLCLVTCARVILSVENVMRRQAFMCQDWTTKQRFRCKFCRVSACKRSYSTAPITVNSGKSNWFKWLECPRLRVGIIA